RSATPTSTTCDSAHGAGGGLSGEYGNRDAGGRGWTWQIGCASTYGASRTTPCTIWSLCVICTSKPRCLLWPRFCVASRNTRGTSWGWSWWRSGMTMTDRLQELRRNDEVTPHDGGCWYCHTADENLVFSIEWDAYVHLACVREALERDPQDAEAWAFALELGVELIEEEVEADA